MVSFRGIDASRAVKRKDVSSSNPIMIVLLWAENMPQQSAIFGRYWRIGGDSLLGVSSRELL